MDTGRVGDIISVEAEKVGHPMREGQVLEVLKTSDAVHYRVRWEDGHESTYFPAGGAVTFRRPLAKKT